MKVNHYKAEQLIVSANDSKNKNDVTASLTNYFGGCRTKKVLSYFVL